MARDEASRRTDGNAFTHFFDRVDRALTPVFEPAPGPTGEGPPEAPDDDAPCPVCGRPMFEHRFAEHSGNVILICPTSERLPEHDVEGPYNELGMPAEGRRLERYRERQQRDEA